MRAFSFITLCAFVLTGCTPVAPRDSSRGTIELVAAAERCGLSIPDDAVASNGDEKFVRLVRPTPLGSAGMDCLAPVFLDRGFGLRTNDDVFDEAYAEAWKHEFPSYEHRQAQLWLTKNRPKLVVPTFSGGVAELPKFVTGLEALCDAPRGTAVVAQAGIVYLTNSQTTRSPDSAECVFAVALASNLLARGIEVTSQGIP